MNTPLPLAVRIFVLSFIGISAIVTAGFVALNSATRARIKDGLRDNLQRTERQTDQQEAANVRHNTELVSALSENAVLKAAISLLRTEQDQTARSQAKATIQDQIQELSRGLDYDVFLVIDGKGEVVATLGVPPDKIHPPAVLSAGSSGPWLLRVDKDLYEITNVPINLGDENLGWLAVGRRFTLNLPGMFGQAVLLGPGGIIASSLPANSDSTLEHQFETACTGGKDACNIQVGGEEYLAVRMGRHWQGTGYQLFRLGSIDEAMRNFTRGLRGAFLETGLVALLMAFLFSLLASRWISKPLVNLAAALATSGETGEMWNEFPVDSSTREVNLLAGALNRAAAVRRLVEGELRKAKDKAEEATNDLEMTFDNTLQALGAALDLRDNETAGHSHRVTRYCLEMAKKIVSSKETLKHIEYGAYLHDLGKIGTPDSILLKPGKLTDEEREVMQRHARVGYELVSQIEFLAPAAEIVLTHQERYDGKGYPQGLAGDAIPLGARIFAIADTFDAMTSNRPYRKGLPLEVAVEEIVRESGRQFDPEVVRVFTAIPQSAWADIRAQVAGLSGSLASRRVPLRTGVICKVGDAVFRTTSLNISESGMLLESVAAVSVGQELEFEISMPGAVGPLRPLAKVVRKRSHGELGIRFTTLTVEARDAIRDYVRSAVNVSSAV